MAERYLRYSYVREKREKSPSDAVKSQVVRKAEANDFHMHVANVVQKCCMFQNPFFSQHQRQRHRHRHRHHHHQFSSAWVVSLDELPFRFPDFDSNDDRQLMSANRPEEPKKPR